MKSGRRFASKIARARGMAIGRAAHSDVKPSALGVTPSAPNAISIRKFTSKSISNPAGHRHSQRSFQDPRERLWQVLQCSRIEAVVSQPHAYLQPETDLLHVYCCANRSHKRSCAILSNRSIQEPLKVKASMRSKSCFRRVKSAYASKTCAASNQEESTRHASLSSLTSVSSLLSADITKATAFHEITLANVLLYSSSRQEIATSLDFVLQL